MGSHGTTRCVVYSFLDGSEEHLGTLITFSSWLYFMRLLIVSLHSGFFQGLLRVKSLKDLRYVFDERTSDAVFSSKLPAKPTKSVTNHN